MTFKIKKPLAQEVIEKVACSSQTFPILLFDTSAIIEIEDDHPQTSCKYLEELTRKYDSVFPDFVMKELILHNAYSRRAGRKEISDKTMGVIIDASKRNKPLTAQAYSLENSHDVELIRYQIYLAMDEIFKNNYKKSVIDPVSRADRQVIETAYLIGAERFNTGNPTPVRVISKDGHIMGSIDFLNRRWDVPYADYNVKSIYAGRK